MSVAITMCLECCMGGFLYTGAEHVAIKTVALFASAPQRGTDPSERGLLCGKGYLIIDRDTKHRDDIVTGQTKTSAFYREQD